jgi:hypothetical protein
MSELVKQMLDNVIDDNHAEAQDNFNAALSQKITDALDQRKIEIAQSLGADDGEVQAS